MSPNTKAQGLRLGTAKHNQGGPSEPEARRGPFCATFASWALEISWTSSRRSQELLGTPIGGSCQHNCPGCRQWIIRLRTERRLLNLLAPHPWNNSTAEKPQMAKMMFARVAPNLRSTVRTAVLSGGLGVVPLGVGAALNRILKGCAICRYVGVVLG